MQTHIHDSLHQQSETTALLYKMRNIPLSSVPFHQSISLLTRSFAEGFPKYVAVHEISSIAKPPVEYTQPHVHEDSDEINIILSSEKLIYKILLGTDEHIISNNTSIWIPRGIVHSANVLHGSGFYIAIRLDK